MLILAINPGSTSTKVAVYHNEDCLWKEVINHPDQDIRNFAKITDQYPYRLATILSVLQQKGYQLEQFNAIVGRGGLLNPIPGGTYLVDEYLVNQSYNAPGGEHASNLGAILAYHLAKSVNIPSYIVDPVAVDEMAPVARLSGLPELPRRSRSHALNAKAVARKVARKLGKAYEDVNLIIAHLGGGISVTPHHRGRMIDVNDANCEGPFSPERSGTLPTADLIKLCYSGKYTEQEMLTKVLKEAGLYAYLGTKDVREIEKRMSEGDTEAKLALEAMCYQVAKEIGAMSTALFGIVDGIVLTGGLAHSSFITTEISRRVSFIAPVTVVPGEEEMEALALGALRVLRKVEEAKTYRA
ncbi:butyrate kinase [Desulforamulus ferrireducens]|uniref:Probable butyrate kinase n=1 Tax=Desulforamulus ferrireducens TaxID=1833852 RepID=A0A1S6IWT3_9FIRM|nr:butyrate kinase [Desulforamulus ferrireducens]AQS59234.1 butyrate kinase [Desulforamulus ferrireducens]